MGLKERKKAKEFQEDRLPGLQAKLNKVAGFEVTLEIDWDSLSEDGAGDTYDTYWPLVFFEPLTEAFKEICRDDMGKEALQEGLKKVVIQNVSDNWSATKWANFRNGVLTLNHSVTTNIGNVGERQAYLQKAVEDEL